MFQGEFSHSLDEKGRVIVPKVHRDAFDDGLYVTRGIDRDRCLWVFQTSEWEQVKKRISRSRLGTSAMRSIERLLYTGTEQQLDNQGRILIPEYLRRYANLEAGHSVAVLGIKNRLELWSPQRWADHTMSIAENMVDQLDDQLEQFGI